MNRETKKRGRGRGRGWAGTRVEVCGYQLATAPNDLICLLPPNHYPPDIHANIAQNIDNEGHTVVVIQNNTEEVVKWLDVAPP